MIELLNLGKLHISDFLEQSQISVNEKNELKLILDPKYNVPRLEKNANADLMYGKYWYRSGINNTMKIELKNIVDSILKLIKYNENDIWLDIACNDGTLLSFVPKDFIRLGIDPADDTFKNESKKYANEIIQDYFSLDAYKKTKFSTQKVKIITSIAMFYDINNPDKFIHDIDKILDDDGLWVLQLSYTPLMIKQLAFDNICHEHIYYYSLFNIKDMLEKNGFQIMDVELNDVNGGSFRLYVMKKNAKIESFSTQPYRDVSRFRINSILEYEKTLKLSEKETWDNFSNKIELLKNQLVNFIKNEKNKGKTIWGYGASTKGNTLLQYFGLDNTLIDGIAEKSIQKFGLKTIGTNIPIYSETEMRKIKPDYLLILPWHFIHEFEKRENEYLINGGKFIVPYPEFKIIEK